MMRIVSLSEPFKTAQEWSVIWINMNVYVDMCMIPN